MTKPAPTLYPVHPERIIRLAKLPPVPDLALVGPTARLTNGKFASVAHVCNVLGEAHTLAHMTLEDLRRLVTLGQLAQQQLEERT